MFSSNTSAVSGDTTYIEDVFSTYLYTGTGLNVNKTITNGIDLSTKGGLVWTKLRSIAGYGNALNNTVSGFSNYLSSDYTGAQSWAGSLVTMTANSDGYTLNDTNGSWNKSGDTFVSWTFRKQPKFFDVVTYTGTGANRTISHSLGATPACIIVKRTDTTGAWQVYHRSLANTEYLVLNTTAAKATGATRWNSTTPTDTVFSLGTDATVNASGGTYVAYIFAHDAGGFGLTGTDNVISCGSYTGPGPGGTTTVTLGYEPQWVLIKRADNVSDWSLMDTMRGMPVSTTATDARLKPNLSDAEENVDVLIDPTATGFQIPYSTKIGVAASYIYIAIRRGPMKVPTSGTTVFSPNTYNTATAGTAVTTNFPVDTQISALRTTSATIATVYDRLRGVYTSPNADGSGNYLRTSTTAAETAGATHTRAWSNTGFQVASFWTGASVISWNFRRAAGFFDVVCYTGTGSATTFSHNLGAVPELMIVKRRNSTASWAVYHSALGNTKMIELNSSGAVTNSVDYWNSTTPTSSVFSIGGSDTAVNASGSTYVAYLFATCAGVSKVGTYTGNGTSQTINCGFTSGARFILIKRTNLTEDWYVWDSARGIVTGNDPSLRLNVTNAESTSYDSIDSDSSGFIVNQDAFENINVNGSTYIFLAIA